MNYWINQETNKKISSLPRSSLVLLIWLKHIRHWTGRQEELKKVFVKIGIAQIQRGLRALDREGLITRERIKKGDSRLRVIRITKEGLNHGN